MIQTIYIEEEVLTHARTEEICGKIPRAVRVPCNRYGEVFNPRAQNFRLQKRQPGLILARKFDHHVLDAPPEYGIGGLRNFYFSHMLNCIYDCRYCFLQGMYRSANYVVFVNYEDFAEAIERRIKEAPEEESFFFSGYDCDSLALDHLTGFVSHFLPLFSRHPKAWIELRTKSTQIDSLLRTEPVGNCIVAFSFTPREVAQALEHKTPSVERRLDAMAQLQGRGWLLGLRFDPLIYSEGYEDQYRGLFGDVFAKIRADRLHSVSLGPFRLPRDFHRVMMRLYPEEKLFASPLKDRDGVVSYRRDLEEELVGFCTGELQRHVPEEILFPCT